MSIRIVISVDITTNDPTEAYTELHRIMGKVEKSEKKVEGWESTDEWYDKYGEPMARTDIDAARQSAWGLIPQKENK